MDFTFPATTTTAAATTTTPEPLLPAAGTSSAPVSSSACRHQLPFPRFVAAASPLRRFPPSHPAAALATEASRSTTAVMAEAAEPRQPEKRAGPGGDAASASASAAAAEVEDRMDQLWEDFNEELAQAVQRRVRGGSWRERHDHGLLLVEGPWSDSPSDAESEPATAGRGCAPVLRPSSRAAGGARHYRRRAGSWVLLMRIFRRLFVVEKTYHLRQGRHQAAL